MTNLQKYNVFNMAILGIAIMIYVIGTGDLYALAFLSFPALIAYVNIKNL